VAVVTGAVAEADVKLAAVATHEFYQPRPSVARRGVLGTVTAAGPGR